MSKCDVVQSVFRLYALQPKNTFLINIPTVPLHGYFSIMDRHLSKVLPPHAFLYDLVHYYGKLAPTPLKTGKWPLGATLRPSHLGKRYAALAPNGNVESIPGVFTAPLKKQQSGRSNAAKKTTKTLAPSVAAALLDFTKNDCYKTDLNLFNSGTSTHTELMEEAWRKALEVTSVRCTDTQTDCHIPISTVEHENTQLIWGRVSTSTGVAVDECSYGADCDAHKIRANQGPLQRYMTPSEQQHFDKTLVFSYYL